MESSNREETISVLYASRSAEETRIQGQGELSDRDRVLSFREKKSFARCCVIIVVVYCVTWLEIESSPHQRAQQSAYKLPVLLL